MTFHGAFSKTLKSLTLFEDAYRFYDRFATPEPAFAFPGVLKPDQHFGAILIRRSLDLEHLSASFMINAEGFFKHCHSSLRWTRLESLVLTSDLLTAEEDKAQERDALLCRARVVVQQMPKLRTFVLWNGAEELAGAFIYQTDGQTTSITWRGSWQLDLSPGLLQSWGQIVMSRRIPCLYVHREHIQAKIKSHADAIYHLRLPIQVVDPASLWQMRQEAYH